MEPSLILVLITICTVIVVDISGFIDTVKHWIWRWLHGNKPYVDFDFKPFECSFCSNWWLSLFYLIVWGVWSMPLMTLALFLSMLTPIIKSLLELIRDFIASIIEGIYNVFNL